MNFSFKRLDSQPCQLVALGFQERIITMNKKTVDFEDLEAQSQRTVDLPLADIFSRQVLQYQDATVEEVLDLLATAQQTYTFVAPTLPPDLHGIAQAEIEFFNQLIASKQRVQ